MRVSVGIDLHSWHTCLWMAWPAYLPYVSLVPLTITSDICRHVSGGLGQHNWHTCLCCRWPVYLTYMSLFVLAHTSAIRVSGGLDPHNCNMCLWLPWSACLPFVSLVAYSCRWLPWSAHLKYFSFFSDKNSWHLGILFFRYVFPFSIFIHWSKSCKTENGTSSSQSPSQDIDYNTLIPKLHYCLYEYFSTIISSYKYLRPESISLYSDRST